MSKVDLLVAPCTYKAAKYAVMNWHYSKAMPAGKLVKFGVWENDKFIGAVLFGRGATFNIGKPYNLDQTKCCELVRVALTDHLSSVTKILKIAIQGLKKASKGLRLIVSYADTNQGHNGGIYQAGNWIYSGAIVDRAFYNVGQQLLHGRTVYSRYGSQSLDYLKEHVDKNASIVYAPPKHKYIYPLDKAMRRQIEHLAQPYPKRADVVQNGNTADDQSANGGSIPTHRLEA